MTESTNIPLDTLLANRHKESIKQVKKNLYWNNEHNEILLSMQRLNNKLYKEYQRVYLKHKHKLISFKIPTIILAAIASFVSTANTGYVPEKYTKWVSLFVGIISLTSGIIASIELMLGINDTTTKSYASYRGFEQLHNEISITSRIPLDERELDGYTTVINYNKRYENIMSNAPPLTKVFKNNLSTVDTDTTEILDDEGKVVKPNLGYLKNKYPTIINNKPDSSVSTDNDIINDDNNVDTVLVNTNTNIVKKNIIDIDDDDNNIV